ncbi:MAG: hypothetical protein FJ284_03915 [Planctomycetes bacterium]|nr:hypothetical protein [Planctomycetota bacterium]
MHARPHDFCRPIGGGIVVRTSLAEFADAAAVQRVGAPAAFPPEEVAARAAAPWSPTVSTSPPGVRPVGRGAGRSRRYPAGWRP